jgi:hypothetical protein
MTEDLHPDYARLLKDYSRALAQAVPSSDLDARIASLVATPVKFRDHGNRRLRGPRLWAAAASLCAVAVGLGIAIGMKLQHARELTALADEASHEPSWPPANFSLWPTDSVALQIPADFSPQGTLVALDASRSQGARYWIYVVVSNDGTVRVEKVVPANPQLKNSRSEHDGITLQVQ